MRNWTDEWNNLHCKCVEENREAERNGTESKEYRDNVMADYLEKTLLEAKEAYYNSGDETMSDSQYDKFEGWLKIIRPNSKFLEKVGA